ncbi:RDD family protein [Nocardioides montaniterrae]
MSHAALPSSTTGAVPAGLEPRLLAFAVDRAIGWGLSAGVAVLVWKLADTSVLVAVLVFVGTLVVLGAIAAVVTGTLGTSVGKAAFGLRVVRRTDGRPIGAGPALVRGAVLGLGGLPTLGLGCAALALTAVGDPQGERRSAHDRIGDAMVVDARPRREVVVAPQQGPQKVVNLTAMRLLPDPTPASIAHLSVPTAEPTPQPAHPSAAARSAVPAPTTAAADLPPRRIATERRWRVSFDTGESFAVEGLAVVGRRPEPRTGETVRHLVTLPSDDMSVSKTHAQFQVAADGALVVMDRGSTNGSFVVRRGHARPLNPGRPSTLIDGDEVRFGDRVMKVVQES